MKEMVGVSATRWTAPSFRIRVLLLRDELARHGVRMDPLPLLRSIGSVSGRGLAGWRDLLRARELLSAALDQSPAEVALISRQADLFPVAELERRAMLGRRVVYDVDDAIWHDGPGAGGHPLAFLKGSRWKARWLAARADHVIAGNDVLAEWLARYSGRITVIPSLIDTDKAPQRLRRGRDEIVIGWLGSRTTAAYLWRLRAPLEQVARAAKSPIRLVVVGGIAPAVRGVVSVQRPWSPAIEAEVLQDIDIGVMPLTDNRWTRGKCAYKAIQYMASGVPVLADDVGVTSEVVGDGGCVVRDASEWADALVELVRKPALRETLGERGRRRAKERFSVAAWAPRIAEVLRGN